MMDVKDKKVLVVGLGVSGFAAAGLLARKGARVSVTENDDGEGIRQRLEKLSSYNIRVELGGHTEDFCADAELVVTSPGIDPKALPLRLAEEKGVQVIGELELGYRFCKGPVIAVTGTNGKSTTTELIGRIMSFSGRHTVVCGNIGNPLSGEVDKIGEDSVAVVEVSSFQIETIEKFKPRLAVLLNVSEDHYDRHEDMESYKAWKFRIFSNQGEDDWAVIHADLGNDPLLGVVRGRLHLFGAEKSAAFVRDGNVIIRTGRRSEVVMRAEEIPIGGEHNLENVACAALVSRIMGAGAPHIRKAVMTFKGLGHRFEKVACLEGVDFIDDSKATNIDATRRALESMDRRAVLIAGGRDKGGDYLTILPQVKEKVKAMVLIGEAREKIRNVFKSAVPVFEASTMTEAVKRAASMADQGEAVLLSPMCSSFDMYENYKERGKDFQKEVWEIFTEDRRQKTTNNSQLTTHN